MSGKSLPSAANDTVPCCKWLMGLRGVCIDWMPTRAEWHNWENKAYHTNNKELYCLTEARLGTSLKCDGQKGRQKVVSSLSAYLLLIFFLPFVCLLCYCVLFVDCMCIIGGCIRLSIVLLV